MPALADVDPLGVNQSVTFDEVGGLDDRSFLLEMFLHNSVSHTPRRHQLFEGDDPPTSTVS